MNDETNPDLNAYHIQNEGHHSDFAITAEGDLDAKDYWRLQYACHYETPERVYEMLEDDNIDERDYAAAEAALTSKSWKDLMNHPQKCKAPETTMAKNTESTTTPTLSDLSARAKYMLDAAANRIADYLDLPKEVDDFKTSLVHQMSNNRNAFPTVRYLQRIMAQVTRDAYFLNNNVDQQRMTIAQNTNWAHTLSALNASTEEIEAMRDSFGNESTIDEDTGLERYPTTDVIQDAVEEVYGLLSFLATNLRNGFVDTQRSGRTNRISDPLPNGFAYIDERIGTDAATGKGIYAPLHTLNDAWRSLEQQAGKRNTAQVTTKHIQTTQAVLDSLD